MEKKPITHGQFMKSTYWSKLSKEIRSDPEAHCVICGRKAWAIYKVGKKKGQLRKLITLQCHHTCYDHMGIPDLEKKDIITCCVNDHKILHLIHDLAKKYWVWEQVYIFLCDNTAWRYIENKKKEYKVPIDFKTPQKRVKKK